MLNNMIKQIKSIDLSKFSQYFTHEKFSQFIGSMGGKLRFLRPLLALYFCLLDPTTPKWAKALIAGVLGYVIFPFDLIPDMTPIAGYADDAIAVTLMIGQAANIITQEHFRKADEAISRLSLRLLLEKL